MGLLDPRVFVKTSVNPSDSATARTQAPAMIPVPGLAGINITWLVYQDSYSRRNVEDKRSELLLRAMLMMVSLTARSIPGESNASQSLCIAWHRDAH